MGNYWLMKTCGLGILLLCLSSALALSQGTIHVGNGITGTRFPLYDSPASGYWGLVESGNGPLSQPTGTTVFTGGLLSGTRYAIEFWAGPASAIDFSGLSLITTLTFRTGSTPGALPNGITTTLNNVPIPGVLAGSQAKLAFRFWDTFSGPNWFFSYIRTQSPLFLSAPLGGVAPDSSLYTSPNWVGVSMSLPFIPEPSALTLVGLGGLALVRFCRRDCGRK